MQISTWKVPAMLIVAVMMVGTAQAMTIEHAKPDPIPNGVVLEMHNGGRMVVASETPYIQHQWPGAYWEASFAGSEITASFADPFNILHIYVDGQNIDTESKPGNNNVRISGLSVGPHTIRVEKVTESQNKVGQFFGFIVPEKENALPALPPLSRQIEFIGDSYTVGYGNTAGKRTCTQDELWASTDTQQAFGPLTAKHYNADYQINAFSGRGIVRNYDGFAGDPLPALYPYALYDGKTAYNDPDWQPQIIVIALGTNDFSTPVHAGEKWKTQAELVADYEASYVTFVKSLRAKNPNAAVLLISYDPATSPQISTVRNRLKADGDSQVDFLEITGFTKNACDYHPDTDDDRKISATLINWFDSRPDLWQGK